MRTECEHACVEGSMMMKDRDTTQEHIDRLIILLGPYSSELAVAPVSVLMWAMGASVYQSLTWSL